MHFNPKHLSMACVDIFANSQARLLFEAADLQFWIDSCQEDRSRKDTLELVKMTWCIHVLIEYAPKLVNPKI